jgi:hypothetical protein
MNIINNPAEARSTLTGKDLDAFVTGYHQGFRIVFIMLATLAAIAFFLALSLLTNIELRRPDDEKMKAAGKAFVKTLKSKKGGVEETGAVDADHHGGDLESRKENVQS